VEVGEVASIKQELPIEDLERCRKMIARDYCCLCVRGLVEADSEVRRHQYVQRLSDLFQAGIPPHDLIEKIEYREDTCVHFALVQRLHRSVEDAADTLRP
jgi:hypothetical protein